MPFSKDGPNAFFVPSVVSLVEFCHNATALFLLVAVQGQVWMEEFGCLAV
jgi:hypothetical protein